MRENSQFNYRSVKGKRVNTKGKKRAKNISSPPAADETYIHGFNELSSLHMAVLRYSPEGVIFFLQKDADPNLRLKCSATALHCLFLSATPQGEDYYNHLQTKSGYKNAHNATIIIKLLVEKGARLLPDSCGLSPISLAIFTRSKLLGNKMVNISDISVDDVIHYNYFSLPKCSVVVMDLLKHTNRLRQALLFHVKHGINPNRNIPLDGSVNFLSTLSSTIVSDTMDVYASQFNSYLALRSNQGNVLFPGVRVLLHQVSDQAVFSSDTADLASFIYLFNNLIAWLNSHESLNNENVMYCWQHMAYVMKSESVRAKLDCFLPQILKFLYKFVLPRIESFDNVHTHAMDLVLMALDVIALMKVVSDSEHVDLFPRRDQESVFSLLNRTHLVLLSVHSLISGVYLRKNFLFNHDMNKLLDFTLPYLLNINSRIFQHDGTLLHTVAQNGNAELLRYFLNAGVSPFVKDRSGNTFITVLVNRGFYGIYNDISHEFILRRPHKLAVISAKAYIRYRLPLKHLHRYPLLRNFVVNLCTREECRQMCLHCYKEYFS